MGISKIESLLEAANSSADNDSSVNVAKRIFLDDEEAGEFFQQTRGRMIRIDEWKKSSSLTDYEVFDGSGQQVSAEPLAVGRFIRIALTGAGKYDWVHIDEIIDEPSEFLIVVRPTHDPTKPDEKDKTSHFFWPEARNHFCLQLNEKTVAFYVIGLNERQNTEFTDSLIESARNAAVANVGYYSGIQKSEWKSFCRNMLQIDEEKSG